MANAVAKALLPSLPKPSDCSSIFSFAISAQSAGQRQAAERLERLVEVPPAQTCRLSVTKAAECLERIEDAPVLRDAPIGDQLLDLFARVDRGDPPGWILVDLLRKDATLKHTGSRVDQLLRDRRTEKRRGQMIDVVDRSRRSLLLTRPRLCRRTEPPPQLTITPASVAIALILQRVFRPTIPVAIVHPRSVDPQRSSRLTSGRHDGHCL